MVQNLEVIIMIKLDFLSQGNVDIITYHEPMKFIHLAPNSFAVTAYLEGIFESHSICHVDFFILEIFSVSKCI